MNKWNLKEKHHYLTYNAPNHKQKKGRKMWPCQLTAIHSVEASGVLISMPASTAVPELRGI